MAGINRPGANEFAPYYGRYIEKVGDGDILETLARQGAETAAMLRRTPSEVETFRYEPRKWSVREVVGHLIDTERLFAYRALSFARGDEAALPGMDQNDWSDEGGAAGIALASLTDEFDAVRRATVALFARMDGDALGRRGVASGVEFTVRVFPWVIAGHELHHRRLLLELYGLEAAD